MPAPGSLGRRVPEIAWKALAVADLMAIVDYISDDSPTAALALVDDIQGKVAQLSAHPKRGRPGRVEGTRELVVRPNYIVVYAETQSVLTVLRVLHAAQMWP
ncbi:type II toxin-antitoxin system RelE/ParE family toxin [Streptomyces murinus]